ncbi:MAG: MerR family transcriptional regulator [Actinomycetales bacterium]|nr:MAG: MerR family transcriptional regulator [Actinomycetales bacterium]
MTVRTVRFYAGRGLIPPPRREGRNGFYGSDHLARLELVRELQAHGLTLSAIEGYLERIPSDATPEEVALHRTLLAPWSPDLPEQMDRATLEVRSGRTLSRFLRYRLCLLPPIRWRSYPGWKKRRSICCF